mmetsp:Transcript_33324/g.70047  ORF Transcript_33324/g.70047 Transcript_33324/m.70047 type:complete len:160 (+) Transcript_33324:1289-1768(+)
MTALQGKVELKLKAICSDNEHVQTWCNLRMDAMFRETTEGGATQIAAENETPSMIMQAFWTGEQLTAAYAPQNQPAAQLQQQQGNSITKKKDKEKERYGRTQIALLCEYCCTTHIKDIPEIWSLFEQAMDIDTHRDNIKLFMQSWSRQIGIPINVGVFF